MGGESLEGKKLRLQESLYTFTFSHISSLALLSLLVTQGCVAHIKTISYNALERKTHIRMKFWCIQNCVDEILERPGCCHPSFGGERLSFSSGLWLQIFVKLGSFPGFRDLLKS